MKFPNNITKEHLIQAAEKIINEGIPSNGHSSTYDVNYNDHLLPPKLIVSYANQYANGTELDRNSFEGGIETPCFKLLKKYDFVIQEKTKQSMNQPKIWFVAQGKTFTETEGMIFLWAPSKGSTNRKHSYWDNVLKVKKGDIIFNYSNGLKGVSVAYSDGYIADNINPKSQWVTNGYKVDILLTSLNPLIPGSQLASNKDKLDILLSSIQNKPFNSNGGVNQGYLFEFTKEAARFIRDLYGKSFGNKIIDDYLDNVNKIPPNADNTSKMDLDQKYKRIMVAMKTKPFVLLAGLSGTGKSRLVRTLAYKTCIKKELQTDPKKPGNFELIPVRPNWHDSSELMGYVSRINGEKYIITSFLQFIAKAWRNLEVPFFLCLDEMNLAPVEQYFAEYLSIIETRQVQGNKIVTDYLLSKSSFENQDLFMQILKDLGLDNDSRFIEGIGIPSNLIVIGTVNMDETTHSFSRKVLDRAMTFEMNHIDLNAGLDFKNNDWIYPSDFINPNVVLGEYTAGSDVYEKDIELGKKVIDFLEKINNQLDGSPFKIAYRVRDEFLIYCYFTSLQESDPYWLNGALDAMTSMKILSRIEGDDAKTGDVLRNLQKELSDDFVLSKSKLKEMEIRLGNSGYTSFWA